MKVLYINYVDFNKVTSGSSVRPKEMYDAFNNLGYEVTMLSGLQNRFKERWSNAWKFYKEIRNKKYDICYVESPSGPIFNICDHLLLIYISKIKKIPVGFFYRDAFWKFAKWYKVGKVKKIIIDLMHKFDWMILKATCTKIYFPSETMADLFKFKNKGVLFPGSDIKESESKEYKDYKNCIYVGGVSERYGTEILLRAFEIINNTENKINLTLICREENDIIDKYKKYDWLKLYTNVSGADKLRPHYENSDLAIIPFKRDVYMDFAMPIKMFEYIANGMPIVATNCIELSKFISENNVGIITDDNSESLAKGILKFYNMSSDEKEQLYSKIQKSAQQNSWEKRAEVIKELC